MLVRSAFVEVSPFFWARLRAGQFKRPYSQAELASLSSLPFVNRGFVNDRVTGELAYAGRDRGIMLHGAILPDVGLTYALGVFNGEGIHSPELDADGRKDGVVRLSIAPTTWFEAGVNASMKWFDTESRGGFAKRAGMYGGDVVFSPGSARVTAEFHWGDNHLQVDTPQLMGGLLELSNRFRVGSSPYLALEPVMRGEWLVFDTGDYDSSVWEGLVGANLHVTKYMRVMLDASYIHAGKRAPDFVSSHSRLLMKLAVDL